MSGVAADIVVIGSGLGGAFAALDLSASSGLSVLVLESGDMPPAATVPGGLARRALMRLTRREMKRPYRWPGLFQVHTSEDHEPQVYPGALGHGVGGSGAIYGAALGRFRRSDFEVNDSADLPSGPWGAPLPNDWPLSASEMAHAYDRAEVLLGVVGGRDPLEARPLPPLPQAGASARDRRIMEVLGRRGAHPYRLPVGIDYDALTPGAPEIEGRRNGWNCGLERAVRDGRLTLRTGAHVVAVDPAPGGFSIRLADGGRVGARRVVLAAGALNTPRILMASPALFGGRLPEMLGRGLMFHNSDFFYTRLCGEESPDGPRKSIALRDGYDLPSGRPGGELQSLPISLGADLVAEIMGREGGANRAGALLRMLRRLPGQVRDTGIDVRRLTLFATILEDLPYAGNRVLPAAAGAPDNIGIVYRVPQELTDRQEELRTLIRGIFDDPGSGFLSFGRGQMNWGHPCGTCRMGRDPASSVTDGDGRLHGVEGVRIADASVFASSGGTNPGLTVVAQALRVAAALRDDAATGAAA